MRPARSFAWSAHSIMLPEKATLRDLLAWLPEKSRERKPSGSMLRESGFPIAVYEDNDLKISIYPSGYALAESSGKQRVFDVRDCGSYTYRFGSSTRPHLRYGEKQKVDEEVFMDQPWRLRIVMEALDRLSRGGR